LKATTRSGQSWKKSAGTSEYFATVRQQMSHARTMTPAVRTHASPRSDCVFR
jgi:hypothetical protein